MSFRDVVCVVVWLVFVVHVCVDACLFSYVCVMYIV